MKNRLLAGFSALCAVVFAAGAVHADSVADTYRGKTVTILFGYSVGGTYGQYAMLMSEFLPRFIPGHPNIITQSMPGAGGLKATNYAYNILPKNGLGLFEPPDSTIISEILNPKAARYKSSGFTWLGNVAETNSVVVVTKRSGVTSFQDAMKRQVVMSSTGKGSQTFLIPAMLRGLFGAKFKIIMGYKGQAGSTHAMELGETQGVSLTWTSLKKNHPHWFDSAPYQTKGIPIIQVGFRKEPDLMNVPLASDLAKTNEEKQIVNFMASLGPIGRGLCVPPGVNKTLIAALRTAFDNMVKDSAFRAAAKKRKLAVNPKTGAEVQAIVDDVQKIDPAIAAKARKMVFGSAR